MFYCEKTSKFISGLLKRKSDKNRIPSHLSDIPQSEWTLWELRMFSSKDGNPIPIVSMKQNYVSHEECERLLTNALKPSLLQRLLNVKTRE